MATSTTKLGLTKPDFVDVVDVSELNTNADAIDAAVGATIVTSATRPASPWAGQIIYETDTESTFVWTGSAWIASGGGASVTVATTAPAGPDEGDLWLNSTEAKMYVYYDDGTSAQWVAAVGGTVPQQGKILQVVSTTKTDTFSASLAAGAFAAITGLTATITPSSIDSKILVFVSVNGAGTDGTPRPMAQFRFTRGGTVIGVGDAAGSRSLVSNGSRHSTGAGSDVLSSSQTFLDSPSTTSATTYGVDIGQLFFGATSTIYVNRSASDTDNVYNSRYASSITLMEVAD